MEKDFSDQELKFSYWYIIHKIEIRRWITLILGVVAFLFWLHIIWQMTFFAINFGQSDYYLKQMVFGDNFALADIAGSKPQNLQISDVEVFGDSGGPMEMAAMVGNPNANWVAEFNYRFNDSNSQPQFILPGEQAYLLGLNLRDSAGELKIADLSWQRVGDFQRVYDDKYSFTITNDEFIPGVKTGDPNALFFEIKNDSAYSFWETEVQGLLYSGGNLAAVGSIKLTQLKSGETREVEMFWNKTLPRVDQFEIIPRVNVVSESNIMPPQGGTVEYH